MSYMRDIGETTDLSKEHPEIVSLLLDLIAEFRGDLEADSRPAAFVENAVPTSIRKP